MTMALEAKLGERGDSFSLCTIMNVKSGRCSEDCAFCAQSSRYRTGAAVYSLVSVDDMVTRALEAKEAGASRFSLVASGRGPASRELDILAEAVCQIRARAGIKVCASLGIVDRQGLETLKAAGLSRYHHNLETSEAFFPGIVSSHTYRERVDTIRAAKEVGLEVCSGGIIGLGETAVDRMAMALALRDLGVDSVPLNILVPIEGTPLADLSGIAVEEILRTIAVFRLVNPGIPLRIAGGRDGTLADFQAMAFWAGADAMLIGGYLTVRGRSVDMDLSLVGEMKRLWKGEMKNMNES